jgi:hypothetical protein
MPPLLAAIKANPMQFLQMLFDFIQQFAKMMQGTNDDYKPNSLADTQDYLDNLNKNLQALNKNLEANNLPPLNLPDKIDTVEEANWVREQIALVLEKYGKSLDSATVQELERTIGNLDNAIAQLSKAGKLEDLNWSKPTTQSQMLQPPGSVATANPPSLPDINNL